MPATAGRVRMPANNRVHSSAALQTHGIWQSAIGYDPYAPTNKDDGKRSVAQNAASAAEPESENAYASFQGLLALAKITNSNSDEARGACKRCGRVGHLYVNCKNFLSLKDGGRKDDDLIPEVILEKLRGEKMKKRGESSDSDDDEEEDSESSDSDYDSEIEKILAEKARKSGGKVNKDVVERGRSKKRRGGKRDDDIDSEDEGRKRKRREEKRRRDYDDESPDEEEERRRRRKRKSRKERTRRRSHHHSSSDEDSSEASPDERRKHKRRSKRADSDSGSDSDRRVGRDKKRRRSVKKKSRKSRHEDEN